MDYPFNWYATLYRQGWRAGIQPPDLKRWHEWELAAVLGFDLPSAEGPGVAGSVEQVRRAITERVAKLRTLAPEVRQERAERFRARQEARKAAKPGRDSTSTAKASKPGPGSNVAPPVENPERFGSDEHGPLGNTIIVTSGDG